MAHLYYIRPSPCIVSRIISCNQYIRFLDNANQGRANSQIRTIIFRVYLFSTNPTPFLNLVKCDRAILLVSWHLSHPLSLVPHYHLPLVGIKDYNTISLTFFHFHKINIPDLSFLHLYHFFISPSLSFLLHKINIPDPTPSPRILFGKPISFKPENQDSWLVSHELTDTGSTPRVARCFLPFSSRSTKWRRLGVVLMVVYGA